MFRKQDTLFTCSNHGISAVHKRIHQGHSFTETLAVSCRRLHHLLGLEEFRSLRMEPGFLRTADELLTSLVLQRCLPGLLIGPRQGG